LDETLSFETVVAKLQVIRILAQGLHANKYNATWNLRIAVS